MAGALPQSRGRFVPRGVRGPPCACHRHREKSLSQPTTILYRLPPNKNNAPHIYCVYAYAHTPRHTVRACPVCADKHKIQGSRIKIKNFTPLSCIPNYTLDAGHTYAPPRAGATIHVRLRYVTQHSRDARRRRPRTTAAPVRRAVCFCAGPLAPLARSLAISHRPYRKVPPPAAEPSDAAPRHTMQPTCTVVCPGCPETASGHRRARDHLRLGFGTTLTVRADADAHADPLHWIGAALGHIDRHQHRLVGIRHVGH